MCRFYRAVKVSLFLYTPVSLPVTHDIVQQNLKKKIPTLNPQLNSARFVLALGNAAAVEVVVVVVVVVISGTVRATNKTNNVSKKKKKTK